MGTKKKEVGKYKRHTIYGNAHDIPLGYIVEENIPEGQTPLEVANEVLKNRDMIGMRALETEQEDTLMKTKGTTVHFLYKKSSYIDVENAMGRPIISFHLEALDGQRPKKGIGFAFCDLEIAELAMTRMLSVIRHLQAGEKKKEKTDAKN